MSILALNCGSSSVKYQLYNWDEQKVVASGLVDRIGMPGSNIKHNSDAGKVERKDRCPDHKTALQHILDYLIKEAKIIEKISDVEGVGHRVVHGGEQFSRSVLITEEVLAAIKQNVELAPLHNPPNIIGIESALEVLANTPQVAIFDTAFHQTIPDFAYMYALDYDFARKYGVRRYGFHGSSHRFIAERAAQVLNNPQAKIISVHVGNGSSVTAIKAGQSMDTSMGMTPLPGVVMGTRSGDIDPAVIPYIMSKNGETADVVVARLNKQSGMLGISGISSDQREIYSGAEQGDARCKLALQMQAYSIRKYIGSYLAALGGAEAIIFTAGIGENSAKFRTAVCTGLEGLGIKLDAGRNEDYANRERKISTDDSLVQVWVIPTNEEYILARDVIELVRGKR